MKKIPRFTLRIPPSLMTKVAYTANFYARTKNKEIEFIIRKYIADFERMYGIIDCEDDD